MTAVWQTAVQYHAWHALALFGVGPADAALARSAPALGLAGWLFVAGIVLFSGSLYALALTGVRAWGRHAVGGVAFLCGGRRACPGRAGPVARGWTPVTWRDRR